MTTSPPKIRIVIEELRMRGMPSRDARRLIDSVERELLRLAPEIAHAVGQQAGGRIDRVKSPAIAAPRRIETAGSPIAQAIVKALGP